MEEQEKKIIINQKYIIELDRLNYILYKSAISKKSGKSYLKALGYYPTMEKVIVACRNEMAMDELCKLDSPTMDDALSAIVRCTNHLEALVKSNFKGVEI